MTSLNQFVLMDFDSKDSLFFKIPGAEISLKNPESGSREIRGQLRYSAPHMLKDIENPNLWEKLPCGIHYDLLRCSWPCWLPNYGHAISALLIAGALYIDNDSTSHWNLQSSDSLSEFIIWHWAYSSKKHAESIGVPYEMYCEDNYFPRELSDISKIQLNNRIWLYALDGFGTPKSEAVNFYTSISKNLILTLTFSVNVTDSRIPDFPELNNLKHKIITDYLKHVIIEPRPMTETVPA